MKIKTGIKAGGTHTQNQTQTQAGFCEKNTDPGTCRCE